MSCYEWERGTIKLPSAAVAPLKKRIREAANQLHEEVLAECKAWWAKNKTTSWDAYQKRLQESAYEIHETYGAKGRIRVPAGQVALRHQESYHVLDRIRWSRQRDNKPPRQVQVADLKNIVPRYTNRDNTFSVDGEASISFDGNNVTWAVDENNHACDRARSHRLGRLFFTELNRISWTRGSGGTIVGNNEYNRDDDNVGGGGNYVVDEYGPKVPRNNRYLTGGYRY